MAEFYRCAHCGGDFTNKQIEVDHIDPVVEPSTGFSTWDNYINRLFGPLSNYQVLCKPCHRIKSNQEKEQRK